MFSDVLFYINEVYVKDPYRPVLFFAHLIVGEF